MRIGLFSDTFPPEINGVGTATNTLKKAFEDNGHEVYVVTTNPFSSKTTFENHILRVPGISLKKMYNYKMAGFIYKKAEKIIRKLNLDIIHVQTEFGIGIFGRILASKYHIPLVYTYHTMYIDYTYYVTKGKFDQTAKAIVRRFSKLLSDSACEMTTPSFKTKEALRSYGVNRYINVIPNGLDLSRFKEERIDMTFVENIRNKYDLKNKFVILSLGRLASEKSVDVLLKNYAKFLSQHKEDDTRFMIVGDGPARESLEKLSKDLGIAESTIFVGAVPYEQVPNFYYLSDLFMSASTSETQGLTFIESIATKTMVMCRFDENLVEVIEEGKTGYYFDSQQSFINKLKFIMSMDANTKNRIIEESYERNQKYSLEKYYERMLEVYNRAIRSYW